MAWRLELAAASSLFYCRVRGCRWQYNGNHFGDLSMKKTLPDAGPLRLHSNYQVHCRIVGRFRMKSVDLKARKMSRWPNLSLTGFQNCFSVCKHNSKLRRWGVSIQAHATSIVTGTFCWAPISYLQSSSLFRWIFRMCPWTSLGSGPALISPGGVFEGKLSFS